MWSSCLISSSIPAQQFFTFCVFFFRSQVPRLDEYMRANLAIFKDIFGGDFFSHVILVFTRWGYDPRSIRDREQDSEYEH